MDLGLEGATALTVASSSGLGKASATALAQEGANVVVKGRDENQLNEAVADIDAAGGGDVVGVAGDITRRADVEALVEATVAEFGGIDHLVTSAGGPPHGEVTDLDEEAWYDAYNLLVMSVVRLVHEAAEHLQDGGGSAINITSITVKEAFESIALSNSVRMSVIGLEKTLSRELAPEVRANAVLPGFYETSRFEDGVRQDVENGVYESYEAGVASRAGDVPLERAGQPRELGDLVAFLCSPRAAYVNRAAILADGGYSRSNL
jgi:NAD(P)-dependent dehydrogenase (short-subunit alcohol dehydrogenase family)